MSKSGDIVKYANQDGVVKAQLVHPVSKVLGFVVWQVKITGIVKRASFGGNPKVGQVKSISSRWFLKLEH